MLPRSSLGPGGVVLLLAALLPACETAPGPVEPVEERQLTLETPAAPLYCPQTTAYSASAVLDEAGGTVSVRGHELQVPAGALPGPVRLDVTVPTGDYLLLDITADGQEHYEFQKPVRIAIDYGHCPDWEAAVPFSAWYYDPESGTFLEHMGGTDDAPARKHRFYTDHLSGYVIAD